MSTFTVSSGGFSAVGGVLLVAQGDPPTLVNNADPANDLYVSTLSSTSSTDLDNVVALQPGQSVTFDGTLPVFGYSAPGQAVLVQTLPGATSISLSLLQAQLIGANLAKETGGNLAGVNLGVGPLGLNGYLGGTLAGALVSTAGLSVARDMLAGNAGVTQELAALVASGSTSGTPGGVPLLRLTRQLGQFSNLNLPAASGNGILTNGAANQPGYEIGLVLNLPLGVGTVPFANLVLTWSDKATGLIINSEGYILTAGNGPSSALTYYLTGPCRGDQLSVNIQNLDPAQAMTLNVVMNTTSHIYSHDRILQPQYGGTAPVGFTNPNGIPYQGVLCIASPTVAALATTTRLLAVWNGKCMININARAQANNISYTLQDPGTLYSSTANGVLWSADTPTGGSQLTEEIVLPNGPVLFTETNRGASGNVAPTVTLTKMEY